MQAPPGEREPGEISLFVGPMFSGKTTRMLGAAVVATYSGADVCVVKWEGDTRPGVATHSGLAAEEAPPSAERGGLRLARAARLADLGPFAEGVVGVDEGQFFPDLAETAAAWARAGKTVFVAALDADFRGRPFEQVSLLLPESDRVEKCRGYCMACRRRRALFSQRLGGGRGLIEIGAADRYRAVCRACYAPPGEGPAAE